MTWVWRNIGVTLSLHRQALTSKYFFSACSYDATTSSSFRVQHTARSEVNLLITAFTAHNTYMSNESVAYKIALWPNYLQVYCTIVHLAFVVSDIILFLPHIYYILINIYLYMCFIISMHLINLFGCNSIKSESKKPNRRKKVEVLVLLYCRAWSDN